MSVCTTEHLSSDLIAHPVKKTKEFGDAERKLYIRFFVIVCFIESVLGAANS